MQEIFVQFPTYQIAHTLDESLSKVLGEEFSSKQEQQRLAAILFALKDLGPLTSSGRGRQTWYFFDPKEISRKMFFE